MKSVLLSLLKGQKKHISFHTPGHKRSGADITELSYSDNLLSPCGVIKQAEEEIAAILGAKKSYIVTDGATCGVHSMLCALKAAGAKRVAFSVFSHKSVKEGCALLGLIPTQMEGSYQDAIPMQPTVEQMERALQEADALLLTSPDYYGNLPPLREARALCNQYRKPLLIDGAHGSHLHFCENYAGRYADMWVDSVHKSLPALTQGAVVSAQEGWDKRLKDAVSVFRTTSPSYPIMASVEYAVKYPRNEGIEQAATQLKRELGAVDNADWTKILLPFGDKSGEVQRFLEKKGVYPEFNDGNYLMFYLSPCTKIGELKKLKKLLKSAPRGRITAQDITQKEHGQGTEWVPLSRAEGRACALECGLFPPCIPLLSVGDTVEQASVRKLQNASSTFGLDGDKILVFSEKE